MKNMQVLCWSSGWVILDTMQFVQNTRAIGLQLYQPIREFPNIIIHARKDDGAVPCGRHERLLAHNKKEPWQNWKSLNCERTHGSPK